MKKCVILLLLLISLKLTTSVNSVNDDTVSVDMSASAAILMDKDSGRILFQRNIHERFLTASISKIMTAIIAIELGNIEEYYEVDEQTIKQEGSSLYLELGDKIKLIDLLYGLMLKSGNDAAYLIATKVTDSYDDFIFRMNEKAKVIGMKETVFSNPSGLDDYDANYSSCFDMALLMAYASDNLLFQKITKSRSYSCVTSNGIKLDFYNKHSLIQSFDYVVGGKTGYTTSAKRTLVSSAYKDNMHLIAVTLNSNNDDFIAHKKLFEYGFENYKINLVLKKQILKVSDHFYKATPIILEDIKYPVKENEELEYVIFLLKEPSSKLIIGSAKIYLNGKHVKTVNIYRYY